MTTLGEMSLEDAALEVAGNWREFDCFVWYQEDVESPDDWAIIYTHNRDSRLLDLSNASVIGRELEPFTTSDGANPDVVMECHSHWAVGWVNGFSIRVYKDGQITDAFRKYHEIAERMDDYPILDETDYSNREYEATIDNIGDAAWRVKDEYELPDGWQCDVYSWLSDHDEGEVENADDQGGYPSEESLRAAFDALGFQQTECV